MRVARTIRWKWAPLILLVAAAPPTAVALRNIPSNTTDMTQWLPDSRESKLRYDWFSRVFGVDDTVLVAWEDGAMDDPRIAAFESAILSHQADQGAARSLFARVHSGPSLARQVAERAELSESEAEDRFRGVLVGPQGQTGILIAVSQRGRRQPAAVVETLYQIGERCGVPRDQLRMGGSVRQVTSIDQESMNSLYRLTPWSALVGLAVASVCLRSFLLTAIAMLVSGSAAALSVALVYFTGYALNSMMIVMPTLVFVLTVSGSVHLLNYYADALEHYRPERAILRALRDGGRPCALAMLTTSIGMASLCISDLRPIREFGVFSAASLLLALGLLLVVLPAALAITRPRAPAAGQGVGRWTQRWLDALIGRAAAIALASILAICLLGGGLAKIRSTVSLDGMFRPGHRLLEDYRWIEERIGPLGSVEAVLRFDGEEPPDLLAQLEMVRQAGRSLGEVEQVGAVFSAADLLPVTDQGGGLRGSVRRTMLRKRLERDFDELAAQGVAAMVEGRPAWRISARVSTLEVADFAPLIDDMRSRLEKVDFSPVGKVKCDYTGSYPVLYDAQQTLLADLCKSFLTAFLLIYPLMAWALRSWAAGGLAMLPNVAPVVTVFGGLGWLGQPVDIACMLTASVALGIAVDDTLHFLTWHQRSLRSGLAAGDAVREAYRRCAGPMVQTSLICGFGVLVFAAATFVPAGRFAVMLFLLLLAALAGDLMLLPALLATPLGRVIPAQHFQTSRPGNGPPT